MKKGFQSYVDLTMKGCWMGNFVIEFCHYFIDKYEESLEENYDKHDSVFKCFAKRLELIR